MKQERQRSGHERVSFSDLKLAFPLRDVVIRELGGRQHQKTWKCPFHDDRSPSFSLFKRGQLELFKCHSPTCGETGSVLDFVWLLHEELRDNGAATLAYLSQLSGQAVEAFLAQPPKPREPDTLSGGPHEAGGVLIDRANQPLLSLQEVYGRHKYLLTGLAYEDLRDYSTQRGWLLPQDQIYGTAPYPIGAGRFPRGRVSHYPVVGFPKLVRTSRLAFLLGREEQFETQRELCVSYRLRLTPKVIDELWQNREQSVPAITERQLHKSRWLALPGNSLSVPGEIDANDDAPVLVLLEGPGDAVRLFNEAHLTPAAAERFGKRLHITYVDGASALSPASLERRPRPTEAGDGLTQVEPVSFFDDYKLIVIIFDGDEAGSYAASVARWLAHRQAPRTAVKTVVLPNGLDVGDFFDDGHNNIYDFADVVANTQPSRGIDYPDEQPPEPPKKANRSRR